LAPYQKLSPNPQNQNRVGQKKQEKNIFLFFFSFFSSSANNVVVVIACKKKEAETTALASDKDVICHIIYMKAGS